MIDRRRDDVPSVRIGCAGWSIPPAHAAQFSDEGTHLERYACVFDAVEINSSFYRPHQPRTYRRWAESVPPDFRFSAKMPKAISHAARLQDCDSELRTFLDEVSNLGPKLGCLLLQLPPGLAFDAEVALPFIERLRMLHAGAVACEPRHPSWFTAAVERSLRERDIARVAADPARVPRAALPAGDRALEYVRLHGGPRVYYDAYSDAALERIVRRLSRRNDRVRERWCIFDNTALGHATADALKVMRAL